MARPSAPATASPGRRKPRENQYFQPGIKGRKTGLTVPDTGVRDEHGLEPMDHLFDSPDKTRSARSVVRSRGSAGASARNANTTVSVEEEMDLQESTVPDPEEVLTARRQGTLRMPLPRSKSPIKTNLQSPARRNPSMGPPSPSTGFLRPDQSTERVASVSRKLDFSKNDLGPFEQSPALQGKLLAKLRNGQHPATLGVAAFSDDEDSAGSPSRMPDRDRSMSADQGDAADFGIEDDEVLVARQDQEEDGEEVASAGGSVTSDRRQSDGAAASRAPSEPMSASGKAKGKRARSRKSPVSKLNPVEEDDGAGAGEDVEDVEDLDVMRPHKRSRLASDPVANRTAPKKPARGKGPVSKRANGTTERRPQLAPVAEDVDESIHIQPRPPMPGRHRSLFSLRAGPAQEDAGATTTRSGRNSIKPIEFWRGERVEYDTEEITDGGRKLLVRQIKDVVRADEVHRSPAYRSKHNKTKSSKKSQRQHDPANDDQDPSDDPDMEEWELEPGRVDGYVREWNPLDPAGQQADESQQLIAYAAAAINTRTVKDATFGFAKTLTMPFFGAGVVDLPSGAIKRPKNTRRMHMVFFLHYGRVQVMVNNNTFSIGQGGQWMVPRGNFYSIQNVHEKPARIFFCQANELDEPGTGRE